MLPHSYELLAAGLLVLGGALSCLAGYRLFRVVLAIYGFLLGALIVSSIMGSGNTPGMLVGALLGGLAGALILSFAYFVGIALVGAGLGVLLVHAFWRQSPPDPPALLIIAVSVLGALGALWLQRYVLIVGTAFAGAWTMIVGGLALLGDRRAIRAAAAGDVWILYPFNPAPGQRWLPIAWIVIGLIGSAVQLGVTGRRR